MSPKYLRVFKTCFGETTVCADCYRHWEFGQFFLCSHVQVFFQSINAVDDAAVFVAFTLHSLSAVVCC